MVRGDFGLRVFAGTFCAGAGEGGVHSIDERELPVAADVIVVGVGIEYDDGARGDPRDDNFDVADAHAGIEEQSLLGAYDEIRNDFFSLMRFVDGERGGRDFVNFEPGFIRQNSLQSFVLRAGKTLAPFRFFGLGQRCRKRKT